MPRRLLLVGWESADWRTLHPLLDSGQMPALNQLVEHGASGAVLAVQPQLSPMQWASLATGKRAWQHGVCQSNKVLRHHRQAAALWEILAAEGRPSFAVGWPSTHETQHGSAEVVSDRYPEPTAPPGVNPWPPAPAGTYWPGELGPALDPLRVNPAEVASDIICRYVPQWAKVDQNRDRRIGQLRVLLASDFSCQAAMTHLMSRPNWEFASVRFPGLSGIRQLLTAPDEFEFYRDAANSHCRMLDLMLGRLIELAGTEAAILVVSNTGASGQGIFAARGPGFRPDALLLGASVLDITPTVLAWFGLPIGDDMEGRVLLESFSEAPSLARVPDWDARLGLSNKPLPEGQREYDWNFAQSCLEAARYEEALPALDRLFRAFPESAENCHALFQCQLALGKSAEAEATLEVLLETVPAGVLSLLPRAELAWAKRDIRQARSLADELRQFECDRPAVLRRLGILFLRLRDWNALADVAQGALRLDENDPIAWAGLAEAQLRKGETAKAMESAGNAIRLKYFLPEAHFVLARARLAQGQWAEAREAMQTLLKLQPNHRTASAYLRRLRAY